MIPIQISVIQMALIFIVGRYGKELVSSLKASITAKKVTWVKEPYRRTSAWQGVILLATLLTLAMVLPIVGNDGISATDGSIGVVIALLMIAAGAASLLNHTSKLPMIAAAASGVFLAMALATGAAAGSPAIILAFAAFACVLLAFRAAAAHEPESLQDGNTILFTTLAAFFARLVLPQLPISLMNGNTDTPPAAIGLAAIVLFGSVVGVAIAIEILAVLWEKTKKPYSPRALVALSFALSLASIAASVWTME